MGEACQCCYAISITGPAHWFLRPGSARFPPIILCPAQPGPSTDFTPAVFPVFHYHFPRFLDLMIKEWTNVRWNRSDGHRSIQSQMDELECLKFWTVSVALDLFGAAWPSPLIYRRRLPCPSAGLFDTCRFTVAVKPGTLDFFLETKLQFFSESSSMRRLRKCMIIVALFGLFIYFFQRLLQWSV